MFKTLLAFLNVLPSWFQTIVNSRALGGDYNQGTGKAATSGRPWFVQSIGYTQPLYLANLQTVTDRSTLNTDVGNRFDVANVNNKQGIQANRIQIAQLYSFQKCFVARHKTRLQYYRDDLVQKKYRNLTALSLSYDNFADLQSNTDAPQ